MCVAQNFLGSPTTPLCTTLPGLPPSIIKAISGQVKISQGYLRGESRGGVCLGGGGGVSNHENSEGLSWRARVLFL